MFRYMKLLIVVRLANPRQPATWSTVNILTQQTSHTHVYTCMKRTHVRHVPQHKHTRFGRALSVCVYFGRSHLFIVRSELPIPSICVSFTTFSKANGIWKFAVILWKFCESRMLSKAMTYDTFLPKTKKKQHFTLHLLLLF